MFWKEKCRCRDLQAWLTVYVWRHWIFALIVIDLDCQFDQCDGRLWSIRRFDTRADFLFFLNHNQAAIKLIDLHIHAKSLLSPVSCQQHHSHQPLAEVSAVSRDSDGGMRKNSMQIYCNVRLIAKWNFTYKSLLPFGCTTTAAHDLLRGRSVQASERAACGRSMGHY